MWSNGVLSAYSTLNCISLDEFLRNDEHWHSVGFIPCLLISDAFDLEFWGGKAEIPKITYLHSSPGLQLS